MNLYNDFYQQVGQSVELLARSQYHSSFNLSDYVIDQLIPPILKNNIKFYYSIQRKPIGIVTWAWLDDKILKDVHQSHRSLLPNEWDTGNNLFFNDWVTPYGDTRIIIRDMTKNVFPNEIGTGLRRKKDSSFVRINRWIGVNRRNA